MRKWISIIFGLLFILFAVFQYNDPDPGLWISIYLFAAAACFMALSQAVKPWFYLIAGGIYLVAAYLQWPPVFEGFTLDELGMKTINIELARESGGLAICSLVMFVMAVLTRGGRARY
ncbi:transmembrane 220 family protein [Tellurirhabdus bombi]|uniref:transmembrane 220 family protein n=1 Tax=Tellurirhabdus bombi TaxID=2907205 RepID=UPI001F2D3806|nr:transmembrane 220 family protein [Tellurirhabdus bombi]